MALGLWPSLHTLPHPRVMVNSLLRFLVEPVHYRENYTYHHRQIRPPVAAGPMKTGWHDDEKERDYKPEPKPSGLVRPQHPVVRGLAFGRDVGHSAIVTQKGPHRGRCGRGMSANYQWS